MLLQGSLFFYLILILVQPAWADACQQMFDQVENFRSIAEVRDRTEQAPFMVACKEPPDLLKGRPKTGLLVRSVIEKDSRGRTSQNLLRRVLAKVRARVNATKNQIKNINTCMEQKSPECEELKGWVDKELPQYLKEARYHLSLSQSQHEAKTWIGRASESVNIDLDSLGGYKLESWAPLTGGELARSESQLRAYRDQITGEAELRVKNKELCLNCRQQFSEDALLAVRFQHFQTYHQMLAEVPLIQYLKGPSFSLRDLRGAFAMMTRNLDQETKKLEKYEKLLAARGDLSTDVLEILRYSSELEETLLEDSRDCGLATSLVFSMSNRQFGNSIAIGLPILAASFFAAPIVLAAGGTAALATGTSIGIGAFAGAGFAMQSYTDFKNTQKRTLGYVYGDSLHSELASLEDSYHRTKYDAVTLPIGLGLASTVTRSMSVGLRALKSGRKTFEIAN